MLDEWLGQLGSSMRKEFGVKCSDTGDTAATTSTTTATTLPTNQNDDNLSACKAECGDDKAVDANGRLFGRR